MRAKFAAVAAAALFAVGSVAYEGTAHAACPAFADQSNAQGFPGASIATVSGLAYGTYYVTMSMGGGNSGLLNLTHGVYPGFTQGSAKGFVGSGADIYVSWIVPPSASDGAYRDINIVITNVLGQTVCSDTFRVNVV
ncbi:hypothetical protein [Sorangium sp. So ce1078]|uniref:hypothetical protein n=1 Tax=Sorangium sp. So ce1078 TaxID=3133329 RepID=UPI003F631F3C